MSCTVRFEPWGKDMDVPPGRTLLETAREAGIPVSAACGGKGTCGKCAVRITDGSAPEPNKKERSLLSRADRDGGTRLACTLLVTGPLTVQTFPVRVQGKDDAPPVERAVPHAPTVRRCLARCAPPTLDLPVDDQTTLIAALEGTNATVTDLSVDWQAARELPATLRASSWTVEASVRGNEIIAVRPIGRLPLGVAVDLGTTNLAVYPYRLDSGTLTGVYGAPNPLSAFGADIVSRLMHGCAAADNGAGMQRVLVKALNILIERAAADAGCTSGDVDEMVVVGNSGMHHLFLNLPGGQLLRAPYVPALRDSVSIKAREMGIRIAPGGYVYMPALVGGFIGSDLLAVALSTRMDKKPGIRLAVDIGTNTEILLSVNGTLSACSTASGPALEGAALRYGCLAMPGAIDRVSLVHADAPFSIHTIGDLPATGICGSGIVGALACMRRAGIINRSGRLQAGKRGVVPSTDGEHGYVLAPAAATALGVDLTIAQSEIRALQLAKGAIRAGMETLLFAHHLDSGRIDEILIAGTFGAHLQIESAVEIGLLPKMPAGRIRHIGNAAGVGAAFMLLSKEERREADALSRSIRHVELGTQAGFMRRFAESQWFPEGDA